MKPGFKVLLGRLLSPALWVVAAALIAGTAQAGQQGLLWRIDGAAAHPSYLFGTIHSDDPRVNRVPAPVQKALDGSASYVMEVVLDEASILALSVASLLPADQSLKAILSESDYRRTVDAMARYGYPEAAVARLKPWVVLTTLSTPRPRGGEILDLVLFTRADSLGKSIHGLETVGEQVAVLDQIPLKEQVEALTDTLDHLDELEQAFSDLYEAYLSRDLTRLVALSDKHLYFGEREAGEALMKRLIDDRNLRMLERLQPRLQEGGSFIAVGALHLPGEQGLLSLLRRQGFKVTAVY